MGAQLFIIGFCLLWVLMCGRMWWMINAKNVWQRRAIAIGAGLGAAMFYLIGTMVWSSVKPKDSPAQPQSGEEVRVSPRAPAK
jgi:Na+/melibiose symporter-like transporter